MPDTDDDQRGEQQSSRSLPSRQAATPRYDLFFRVTALATVAAVTYLRAPALFHAPRFWAEEATRYFSVAYAYAGGPSWYLGLTNVQRGYVAAWTNFATTLAANLVPLEHAPLLTTLLAALAQLIPCALILWSRAPILRSPLQKCLALLCILFAPLSAEVWLNTINSQFYFALAAFLILIDPADGASHLRAWTYRLLLLLGGLTGLVAVILAPLFALTAFVERKRERAIQAAVVCLCAALQLALLMSVRTTDVSVASRFRAMAPLHLAPAVWTQSLGLVVLGTEQARAASAGLVALARGDSAVYAGVSLALALVAGLVLAALSAWLPQRERLLCIGAYLSLLVFSYFGSLGSDKLGLVTTGSGERYFYVPNVILLLIVASNTVAWQTKRVRSIAFTVLLAWMIGLGISRFQSSLMLGSSDWRVQVALWEEDRARRLEVWPDGWNVTLRKR